MKDRKREFESCVSVCLEGLSGSKKEFCGVCASGESVCVIMCVCM